MKKWSQLSEEGSWVAKSPYFFLPPTPKLNENGGSPDLNLRWYMLDGKKRLWEAKNMLRQESQKHSYCLLYEKTGSS